MALIKYFMAVQAYLFVLSMSRLKKKSNKRVPLIIVNTLILNMVSVKTRRPNPGRLLSLQGECSLMLKMNIQGHFSLTALGTGLLI